MAIHGINIAEIDDSRLIAEMAQGHITEVKMDTLEEEVGGNEGFMVVIIEDSGIIADPENRRGIAEREIASKAIDKSKLAERRNFSYFFHIIYGLQK